MDIESVTSVSVSSADDCEMWIDMMIDRYTLGIYESIMSRLDVKQAVKKAMLEARANHKCVKTTADKMIKYQIVINIQNKILDGSVEDRKQFATDLPPVLYLGCLDKIISLSQRIEYLKCWSFGYSHEPRDTDPEPAVIIGAYIHRVCYSLYEAATSLQ